MSLIVPLEEDLCRTDPLRRLRTSKEKQMGRPLRKDVNGVDVIRSFGTKIGGDGDSNAGIKLEGFFTADATDPDPAAKLDDYIIIKQRGSKTFVVMSESASSDTFVDGESIKGPDSSFFRTGVLVESEPNANGEIRMVGYPAVGGQGESDAIAIAKITKRVATDFSGNRYTWYLTNFEDSTGDQIILTAI